MNPIPNCTEISSINVHRCVSSNCNQNGDTLGTITQAFRDNVTVVPSSLNAGNDFRAFLFKGRTIEIPKPRGSFGDFRIVFYSDGTYNAMKVNIQTPFSPRNNHFCEDSAEVPSLFD